MLIRDQTADDAAQVRAVHLVAFDTPLEADLVETLNTVARPLVSLVAEKDGRVVGHILFSPVELVERPDLRLMGLGPMGVAPALQRKGIGSALVRAGLERCVSLGCGAVVVLGHPEFYPRFGFAPAGSSGIRCTYDVPLEAFMVAELQPHYLQGAQGTVRYHPAFDPA